MLRSVIFDFDGVITDSEILHLRAFNKVLSGYGIEIATKDYYTTYLGLTDVDCFNLLVQQDRLNSDDVQIEDLVRQKNLVFEELAKSDGKIIEGVRDFLEMLAQNELPMAICSGALLAEIELILEEAKLRNFFEVVVSAEFVKKGKPHPEGFNLALAKLNEQHKPTITASNCVVIEDSHWGLEAAKAAGMHTIAVTNTYDADQLQTAEMVISRLNEISMSDLKQLCA
jgi:beta-phosphoglucomutase